MTKYQHACFNLKDLFRQIRHEKTTNKSSIRNAKTFSFCGTLAKKRKKRFPIYHLFPAEVGAAHGKQTRLVT